MLRISACKIPSKNFATLLSCLESNGSLRYIAAGDDNSPSLAVCTTLTKALARNATLTRLHLPGDIWLQESNTGAAKKFVKMLENKNVVLRALRPAHTDLTPILKRNKKIWRKQIRPQLAEVAIGLSAAQLPGNLCFVSNYISHSKWEKKSVGFD